MNSAGDTKSSLSFAKNGILLRVSILSNNPPIQEKMTGTKAHEYPCRLAHYLDYGGRALIQLKQNGGRGAPALKSVGLA